MIDGAVMDSELSPVSGGQGSALRSRRLETSVESVTRTPRHSPELQPSPYLSQTILPTDRSGQTEKFLADYGVKHRLSRFLRAVMQHRNTPDPDTGLSPAQVIFVRNLQDFLPGPQTRYRVQSLQLPSPQYKFLRSQQRCPRSLRRLTRKWTRST